MEQQDTETKKPSKGTSQVEDAEAKNQFVRFQFIFRRLITEIMFDIEKMRKDLKVWRSSRLLLQENDLRKLLFLSRSQVLRDVLDLLTVWFP